MPGREEAGFVDQLGPPGLVAVVDQDPFAPEARRHGKPIIVPVATS
jgi:hypothetical protein